MIVRHCRSFAALNLSTERQRAREASRHATCTLHTPGADGTERVDVVGTGFAVDCLDTLEDLAINNAGLFHTAGACILKASPLPPPRGRPVFCAANERACQCHQSRRKQRLFPHEHHEQD